MTNEELEQLMARLGIKPGDWASTTERPTHMPFVQAQMDNLVKLRDYLEGLVATDNQSLARLREQLTRLQRGGGC